MNIFDYEQKKLKKSLCNIHYVFNATAIDSDVNLSGVNISRLGLFHISFNADAPMM